MAFKKASKKSKFEYRARTSEEMNKRAHQSGGSKEGFIKPEFSVWTPKDGDNKIRILPPTWDDATHYGLEVFAHYQVGPDNSSFLCPKKSNNDDCAVCDARLEAMNDGDEEGARALNWRKRVVMWIIDRKEEAKGAQIWCAPWTLDQEIAKQSIDESGSSLALDHPEEGYDITFTREKGSQNQPPKYTGAKVARRSSPIFDDDEDVEEVLKLISENPLPDCLVFHDSEHVANAFKGKGKAEKKKGDSSSSKKGSSKREEEEDDDLPDWDGIHGMSEKKLTAFAEEQEIDFGDEEFDDLEAVADFVCEALEIEKPKKVKKVAVSAKPTAKKKKKDEEEDDEEEGDEEEDDEEEEEEKPKKKVGLKAKPTAKKKKKDEEEDEEEDDEEEEEEKPKASWKSKLDKFKKKK